MSYVVLARKWRPMLFEDVIGQEHVTRTLMNALKNQRIAHAYIFAGPRGVGKTSTARLLAKAVNCENQPVLNPCNKCPNCQSITDSHSMDVIEIDGASNRGIDEIRNLRENIRFAPASFRYKIYIIDEVHMLTKEAFNALLKTLEEPPAHAIFIFATTEIHRVPPTILSRCQRFDFKRIPLKRILELLQKIVKDEKLEIEPEALQLIARKADGSMRDAESILDQVISFSDGPLTMEQVSQSLGLIDLASYFEFTDFLEKKDTAQILQYADKIISSGHDLMDYLHGLQEHFRNLLLISSLKDKKLIDASDHHQEMYSNIASKFNERDLIHYLHIIGAAEQEIKFSSFQQLSLEMLLLKLAFKPANTDLEEILAFIQKIKENPQILKNTAPSDSGPSGVQSISAETISSGSPRKGTEQKSQTKLLPSETSEKKETVQEDFKSLTKAYAELQKISETKPSETQETERQFPENLEVVVSKWRQFLEKIKKEKPAVGSFLQEGVPYRLEHDTLTIAYDHKSDYHKETVKSQQKFLENAIHKLFNWSIRLNFESIDFKKAGIEIEPRTPEEVLEDIKNKEPIINKIIDLFDLEDPNKI